MYAIDVLFESLEITRKCGYALFTEIIQKYRKYKVFHLQASHQQMYSKHFHDIKTLRYQSKTTKTKKIEKHNERKIN